MLDGNLTAFGKLYAAWDGDATVRADKRYHIHHKGTRKRLASNTAQDQLPPAVTSASTATMVHWHPGGRAHRSQPLLCRLLEKRRTPARLQRRHQRSASTPRERPAADAEWSLTESQHGWHYLGHPASSKRLKMAYNNSNFNRHLQHGGATATGDDSVQWRFIVPPQPPVWSGAVSTSWTDAGNWSPGVVPASGDPVAFTSTSAANLDTMLDQDFDPSGITLTDPAGPVSIGGAHNLTLGTGGFDLSAATRNLTVATPLVLGAAQTWNVAGGRVLGITGAVSGAADLTIAGAGMTSLGASDILPNGASAGNLIANGTLDLNGTSQSVNALTGGGIVDNTSAGAATLNVGGNDAAFTLNAHLQNTDGTLALAKTGAGNLALTGANTFSGGFTNHGTGNVNPQNGGAFGTGPVVMNGATLYATAGSYTFDNALTLNGATLRVGGGNLRTITWTGPVSVTADSIIRCDGGTGGITISGTVTNDGFTLSSAPNGTSNTISGPIGGSGTIMAATFANGTLNLNAANPFSGTYRAALGTLRIGDPGALQNGTLDMNAEDGGTVDLNNLDATIGALTGSRNLSLGSGTVSIGHNHSNSTYGGVLGGSGSLVKTGLGTLALSGPNNYAGATGVHAGTLALGGG
jgi:fibronectin-binding autotransporter adhesin